nr:hypothetical protein CFP56_34797 [Quercus suber]
MEYSEVCRVQSEPFVHFPLRGLENLQTRGFAYRRPTSLTCETRSSNEAAKHREAVDISDAVGYMHPDRRYTSDPAVYRSGPPPLGACRHQDTGHDGQATAAHVDHSILRQRIPISDCPSNLVVRAAVHY